MTNYKLKASFGQPAPPKNITQQFANRQLFQEQPILVDNVE